MAANDVLASLRKNRERLSRLRFSTVNLTPNPLRKIIMELGFILLSRAYVKLSSMARGGGESARCPVLSKDFPEWSFVTTQAVCCESGSGRIHSFFPDLICFGSR